MKDFRTDVAYLKRIEKALFDRECEAAVKCAPTFTITMKETGDLLTIGHWAEGYWMTNSTNPLVYVVENVSLTLIAMLIADGDVRP